MDAFKTNLTQASKNNACVYIRNYHTVRLWIRIELVRVVAVAVQIVH